MASPSFQSVLLEVWREVCRHIAIEESVTRVTPLLVGSLPVDELIVRQVDPARGVVETVAMGLVRPGRTSPGMKSDCAGDDLVRLVAWCRSGTIRRGLAAALRPALPRLLPEGLEGSCLVAPLVAEDGLLGALILASQSPRAFGEGHETLAAELIDPFAVALENDRRVRELVALREAVEAENRSLLSRLGRHDISESIIGAETGLKEVMEHIQLVAPADAPVLILGETGSGKEVVARAIHVRSRRSAGPFLRVNCGAIPADLVDSELFGHERGSFTGAVADRRGWFERADGGTLFLDECGELPLAAQVRLLRILQDGQFERVGGEKPRHVDVRIVAATNRDLERSVGLGEFRQDLWYRLAVFPIHLPPLRDRLPDVPALASHFALRAARRLGLPPLVATTEDIGLLLAYPWPGNIRELAAVIERAAILGEGRRLEIARALGASVRPASGPAAVRRVAAAAGPDVDLTLDRAAARHIERVLARTEGRIEGPGGAADRLGVNPHTLRSRMRKLGIDWDRYRPGSPRRDPPPGSPGAGAGV
ncbi:sigma-54 interaction domain-containing protein [Aquisphaera insulae]|uniref:sigma-54 interaction domain-containing protein n=1 Tax=Aquisphaera insulae TaxID=2712864 RepID=UPI0013EAF9ED|nr:sigma 54-interacting transcriptional regulator [Aquisphaera insulae]